jgi:Uma2 family endonuclease
MSTTKSEITAEPKVHKWTREELFKMWAMGILEGQRVELIDGEVIEMNPLSSAHATAVTLASYSLREIFGKGWVVRIQNPLSLGIHSEPHPDIAVVTGQVRDFKDEHPTTAKLIVEIADSSLAYDRSRKAALYAEKQIPEYWIVNLQDRLLEVYRHPVTRRGKVILGKIDRLPDLKRTQADSFGDVSIKTEQESAIEKSLDPLNPKIVAHRSGPDPIYADILILTAEQSISPLARPEALIAVADLLP